MVTCQHVTFISLIISLHAKAVEDLTSNTKNIEFLRTFWPFSPDTMFTSGNELVLDCSRNISIMSVSDCRIHFVGSVTLFWNNFSNNDRYSIQFSFNPCRGGNYLLEICSNNSISTIKFQKNVIQIYLLKFQFNCKHYILLPKVSRHSRKAQFNPKNLI